MKEFLDTAKNFIYVQDTAKRSEDWIEIPDGANAFLKIGNKGNYFYNFGEKSFVIYGDGGRESVKDGITTADEFMSFDNFQNDEILWQREKIEVCEDAVNNPNHYNKGGIECIDAIQSSMTKEAFCGYLKGNIQKYMWRYENKGGVESLQKAQWYLNKLIEVESIESNP